MPEGTLITLSPAAAPIGQLLRTAIDAEQVGATRLHLPADQPDLELAVASLREHTHLVLTSEVRLDGLDVVRSDYRDEVIDEGEDLPAVVAEVARLVADRPAGVGLAGRGGAALPVLLASLAAGGHVLVAAPDRLVAAPDRPVPAGSAPVRDHAALVARASGLARIAGRPPMDGRAARRLLGLA